MQHPQVATHQLQQAASVVPQTLQPTTTPDKTAGKVQTLKQQLREKLDGEDLTKADNYWRKILLDDESGSARAKGAATRSAMAPRLPSVRGMMPSEECKLQTLKQQLCDEVHDFDGACDWLLQVTVRQHDGKEDEEGERVDSSKVLTARDFRLYNVDAGQLIKVTVRNLSQDREIAFKPVYLNEKGEEEPEESVTLKAGGERYELPYPLEKKEGEKEDSWGLKDSSGKTLLRLRFATPSVTASSAPVAPGTKGVARARV